MTFAARVAEVVGEAHVSSAPSRREAVQEDAIRKMFTPEPRTRLDAVVPFAYLPPAVVARVVDKFILQLELQLADRGVEVSEVDEQPWGRFAHFADPDGNTWTLQQTVRPG